MRFRFLLIIARKKSARCGKSRIRKVLKKPGVWAEQYHIKPASNDIFRICLVAVDVQNTFCIPEFEFYVGGRSGTGAVDDNRRLCEFIYRNLHVITQICPTMDAHEIMQIFHAINFVNDKGKHPAPFVLISADDIQKGAWKFNKELNYSFQINEWYGQEHLLHYTEKLKEGGKYDLTIWPYHAMLGGIGHALLSSFEEAIFFHGIASPTFMSKVISLLLSIILFSALRL